MSDTPSLPPVPDGAVLITMILTGHDEVGVTRDADALAHDGRRYQDRAALLPRIAATDEDVAAVRAWVTGQGFEVANVWYNKIVAFAALPDALIATFGLRAKRWLADPSVCCPSSWPLPPRVRGLVSTMQGRDAA